MKKIKRALIILMAVVCMMAIASPAMAKAKKKKTHKHSYTTVVTNVNPTCTRNGYVVKKCSCGKTARTNKRALGHTKVGSNPADSIGLSSSYYICGRCGKKARD